MIIVIGLTVLKASTLSEMCKREHSHRLCLQEAHRAPHPAMPKITGMTLIGELTILVLKDSQSTTSSKAEDKWNATHR